MGNASISGGWISGLIRREQPAVQAQTETAPAGPGRPQTFPFKQYVVQIAIVVAAYFVAGKLGQATSDIRSSNLGPVWPAYGVALAAGLLYGSRIWPAVLGAAFLVAVLSPVGALTALGQATGTTLASLTGAFVLKRVAAFDPSMQRLKDCLWFIVLGAFGSTLISSSIGTWVLYEAHITPYSGLPSAWLVYWMGDGTGALLVTPLIVTLWRLPLLRDRRLLIELAWLLLLLTASSFIVFAGNLFPSANLDFLAFGVFPFVIWPALRFGTRATSLSVLIIASVATVETALGSGPFAGNSPFLNAILLDVFFTVISVTGLMLAGTNGERREAERTRERLAREEAAADARLRLASIVESSDDAIIGANLDGVITDWNGGAELLLGYGALEIRGKHLDLLVAEDLSGNLCETVRDLGRGASMTRFDSRCRRKDGSVVDVSVRVSPILDIAGRNCGASLIFHDITSRKRQEAILRESESRFRLLANTAPVMIWMAGTDKFFTYLNQRWVEFTGRPAEAGLGRGWTQHVYPEDLAPSLQTYEKAFDQRQPFHIEGRLRRHDGEYRWIFVSGVPRFNTDGSFAGYIGSGVDVTERKLAEETLSNVSKKLIDAQEQEAARIARELHDDVNQRLALLAIKLAGAAQDPLATAELKQMIDESGKELEDLATDIQALSHRIHSSKLEYLGLEKAAASACRELSERQRVQIDFYSQNVPTTLPSEIALCLFRVLQEALQNAVKHSGSRQFEVSLDAGSDEIVLMVRDSGSGFDLEEALRGRGLGLTSMSERLKLVDGTLSIHSKPQVGTTISARVPLSPKVKSASATH